MSSIHSECTDNDIVSLLRILIAAVINKHGDLSEKCQQLYEHLLSIIDLSTTMAELLENKEDAHAIYTILKQIEVVYLAPPLNVSGLTRIQFILDAIDDAWEI